MCLTAWLVLSNLLTFLSPCAGYVLSMCGMSWSNFKSSWRCGKGVSSAACIPMCVGMRATRCGCSPARVAKGRTGLWAHEPGGELMSSGLGGASWGLVWDRAGMRGWGGVGLGWVWGSTQHTPRVLCPISQSLLGSAPEQLAVDFALATLPACAGCGCAASMRAPVSCRGGVHLFYAGALA